MRTDIEERAVRLAEYITENRATVRAAAKKFGVSKSTVHKDITERLEGVSPELYSQVRSLLERGLIDYVAMDIKNAPLHYGATVGIPGFDTTPIERSAALLTRGEVEYEFRTTVVAELHTEADFEAIGRWLAGAKRYFLQGFIDSGDLIAAGLNPATKERMERFAALLRPSIPAVELRGV